jgi:phosphatidylethanolamine-binding protein (PEBP) family uncharacterized protein
MPRKTRSRRRTKRLRRRLQAGGAAAVPMLAATFPATLDVTLNDGTKAAGQLVTAAAATPEPQVSWQATPNTFYTLLCFDPDALAAAWLHWLVTNIEGGSPNAGKRPCEQGRKPCVTNMVTLGETLVPWAPPTPPSGIHRYYFCLFSHDARVVTPAPKEWGYFKPAEFVAKSGLKPVAAAFYGVRAKTPI